MDLVAVLAAVGVGGIVAGILTPWVAGLMSSRQYKTQVAHESELDAIKRQHEEALQEQQRRHENRLRREAAHAAAAQWAVPAVARCLFWVEGLEQGTEDLHTPADAPDDEHMDLEAALRLVFRVRTEHPDPFVREHGSALYNQMLRYRSRRGDGPAARSRLTSKPSAEVLEHWRRSLDIMLPYVHRPWEPTPN